MRVVLDPNVLISALISPQGPSAEVLDAWVRERFELVVSEKLLAELDDVLDRPKFRRWVAEIDCLRFVSGLAKDAKAGVRCDNICDRFSPRSGELRDLPEAGREGPTAAGSRESSRLSGATRQDDRDGGRAQRPVSRQTGLREAAPPSTQGRLSGRTRLRLERPGLGI